MRTTVDLEADIKQFLREEALCTHRPFRRVLNETLRSAIAGAAQAGNFKPFVVKARAMRLRAGLDPLGFSKLSDDLEASAFLDSTRRLKAREK
jgi:hypothetical protein